MTTSDSLRCCVTDVTGYSKYGTKRLGLGVRNRCNRCNRKSVYPYTRTRAHQIVTGKTVTSVTSVTGVFCGLPL